MNYSLSRRRVLQLLTVGAGLSLTMKGGRLLVPTAHAAPAFAKNKRLAIIFAPNGVPEGSSSQNPNGVTTPFDGYVKSSNGPTDFQLGYYLQSFAQAGLAPKLTVLEGLVGSQKGDYHFGGFCEVLTNAMGSTDNYNPRSKGPSIDRFLGQRTGVTPLNLGQKAGTESICYTEGGDPISKENDPAIAYDNLFKNLGDVGSAPDATLLARIKRRKSVLDAVAGDIAAFQKNALPAEARTRTEAQLAAIRSLERSLESPQAMNACKKPERALLNAGDNSLTREVATAQVNNIVAAFACGLTNVATLQFRSPTENGRPGNRFDPVNADVGWHTISHSKDYADGESPNDHFATFTRLIRFYNDVAFDLATKLDAIPELDGTTMLDNTLIVVCSEISSGHTAEHLIQVHIGGKNLGVKGGQYLKFGGFGFGNGGIGLGRAHVSMLQALGHSDVETFGNVDQAYGGNVQRDFHRGPIPGYFR